MLSIFKKKLFADISGNAEDMPPHVSAVLCLMIEIARMDGKIDDIEIDEIKNFYLDLYPNGDFTQAFEELKDWASHKESFNPFINIINSNWISKTFFRDFRKGKYYWNFKSISNDFNFIMGNDYIYSKFYFSEKI